MHTAAAKLWSAVTCHRFLRLADLTARQTRVLRLVEMLVAFAAPDSDKSPAESAVKPARSKFRRLVFALPVRINPCSFVANTIP